jgi:secreted PhoX family phosphatase
MGPLAGCAGPTTATGPRLGFAGVPVSRHDGLRLPPGYEARVLAPWGDPVGVAGQPLPAWQADASQDAAAQALQFGMHHDGLHYFPLAGDCRGLLAINHEYVDPGLLFPDGQKTWTAAKLAKTLAAHGVSVAELAQGLDGHWQLVRPSRWARRISMATPMRLAGPAAGHALLRTAADPSGRQVIGTLGNCGAGLTPWGTFLTGEENWMDCFAASAEPDADQRRWGLRRGEAARWQQFDERFDASLHPHEPHRFGWIVEIDPYDPASVPIKRTALGRAAHEGATVALTRDGRAVVYMGEDARFEYLYKFVSRDADRKSTRLNSSHRYISRMPSSA